MQIYCKTPPQTTPIQATAKDVFGIVCSGVKREVKERGQYLGVKFVGDTYLTKDVGISNDNK